jgi:hypothetical protein
VNVFSQVTTSALLPVGWKHSWHEGSGSEYADAAGWVVDDGAGDLVWSAVLVRYVEPIYGGAEYGEAAGKE